MQLLRPMAVSLAMVTASNLVDDAGVYDPDETYDLDELTTFGGHRWKALQGLNLNHEPGATGSEDWWFDLGADNTMALFDRAVGSVSTRADSFSVEITADSADWADAFAFLNVTATEAEVVVTDAIEGVVETRTVSLLAEEGIIDAWTYCFEDFDRRTDFVIADLPPYAGAVYTVTLSEPGGVAGCGVCVPGKMLDLGGTQWRPKLGFIDFSVKGANDYGYVDVLERDYARTGEFQVWFATAAIDALMRVLARYRATPVVWIGDDRYGATLIYGFFDDASTELTEADQSLLSLSLRGLI